MTKEQKDFIDNSSYETLLRGWRFAKTGDPYFQGEAGEYYAKIMFGKGDTLPPGEAVAVSKRIGWGR